ncbi:MAG TPA: ATP-binding protein [Bacteroidales bacterium]|nr:(4Fe-4S)-binding protein [Bacteroidales bacterium]HNR40764.1 ATP-binding protein [Bacteroidales bacterium]
MEIAIISGKGGTGKSSLSAAFATAGNEIVLADCDVDAANLYLIFNPVNEDEQVYIAGHKAIIDYDLCSGCRYCVDFCRFDAIGVANDKVVIDEISCDGCFLCSRICPENAISMIPNDKSRMFSGSFRKGKMVYGRLAPGEENSGKLVNMVREKARMISSENNLDIILLDGPAGIGCPVISTITGVDRVILVTEPTVSGLSDMQRAVDVVLKFGRKPSVIVNKADINEQMTGKIIEWCHENNIGIAGILPFEKKIAEAMIRGLSIIEYEPECSVSIEIRKIWNNIIKSN